MSECWNILLKKSESESHWSSSLTAEGGNSRLTQFVRDEVLSLNGIPALVAGSTAIAQVKLHFPQNGLIVVLNLEEVPISHCPLLLQRDHKW